MHIITSVGNEKVKYLKHLYTKKGRCEHNKFIAEGEKFVSEIGNDFEIDCFYISESFWEKNQEYGLKGINSYILKDTIFKAVSDTVTPQGIIAVVNQKIYHMTEIISKEVNPFVIAVEKIQDPGNLGAVIRSADAFSADLVLVSEDSVEIWNPKVIRATAGSIFHIPVVNCNIFKALDTLKESGISISAAYLEGAENIGNINFKKPSAILIGNEGSGLSDEIIKKADNLVKIPMGGKAESLNASSASAVFMYEVARQRGIS